MSEINRGNESNMTVGYKAHPELEGLTFNDPKLNMAEFTIRKSTLEYVFYYCENKNEINITHPDDNKTHCLIHNPNGSITIKLNIEKVK